MYMKTPLDNGDDLLTTAEAAALLEATSPATIRNWLEGGHFPGAHQTSNGVWRFPRQEVLAVRAASLAVQERNRQKVLELPDLEDDWPDVPAV